MGQLAIAWVLANQNVSAAIIGASRPAQVTEAIGASGVKLSVDVLTAIDQALEGFIQSDASLTQSPVPRT